MFMKKKKLYCNIWVDELLVCTRNQQTWQNRKSTFRTGFVNSLSPGTKHKSTKKGMVWWGNWKKKQKLQNIAHLIVIAQRIVQITSWALSSGVQKSEPCTKRRWGSHQSRAFVAEETQMPLLSSLSIVSWSWGKGIFSSLKEWTME